LNEAAVDLFGWDSPEEVFRYSFLDEDFNNLYLKEEKLAE